MPLCFFTLKKLRFSSQKEKEIALWHPKNGPQRSPPIWTPSKNPHSWSLWAVIPFHYWIAWSQISGCIKEEMRLEGALEIAWQLYFRSVPPPPWWIVHSLTRSWADKGNFVNLLKIQSKAFLRRIESQIGISARVGTKASAGKRTLNSFVAFRRKGLKFYLVPILWGSRVQWQLALALEPFPKFLPPEIWNWESKIEKLQISLPAQSYSNRRTK